MKLLQTLYIIGAILNIAGSFLPWGCEGDIIWHCTAGITNKCIGPDLCIEDNGGILVMVLSLAIAGLILWKPNFIKIPAIWTIVCAIILVAASIYHIGTWIFRRVQLPGVIGAPTPAIGLWIVLLGSVILLSTALRHYQISRA